MAAAGTAAPGTREAGSEFLVRCNYAMEDGNREWHARMVLAEVRVVQPDHWWFVILTPDSDVYAEDLGPGSVDVVQTRDRPSDRSIPYGIDQAQVYDFATPPTPEQLTGLVAKGRQEAARERVRLGAVPSGLRGSEGRLTPSRRLHLGSSCPSRAAEPRCSPSLVAERLPGKIVKRY